MNVRTTLACCLLGVSLVTTASPASHAAPIRTPAREIVLTPYQRAVLQFTLIRRSAENKAGEMVPLCEEMFEVGWGSIGAATTPSAKRAALNTVKRELRTRKNQIRGEFLRIVNDGKRTLRSMPEGTQFLDDLDAVKAQGLESIDAKYAACVAQLNALLNP